MFAVFSWEKSTKCSRNPGLVNQFSATPQGHLNRTGPIANSSESMLQYSEMPICSCQIAIFQWSPKYGCRGTVTARFALIAFVAWKRLADSTLGKLLVHPEYGRNALKRYGLEGFPSHSSDCSGGLFPQYSGVSPILGILTINAKIPMPIRGQKINANFFCTKFFDNPSGHGRPRRKSWTSAPKSAFSCGPAGGAY